MEMDRPERLPISAGFYLAFSKDGRAISSGRNDSQVMAEVSVWMETHEGHQNYSHVSAWVEQKSKQIEADALERRIVLRRDELHAAVDKAARESGLRDKNLIALARTATFKAFGIPEE